MTGLKPNKCGQISHHTCLLVVLTSSCYDPSRSP